MQPLDRGGADLERFFRKLPVTLPRLAILRLGGKGGVAVAPLLDRRRQGLVLLFRKLPDDRIQIGVRHCLSPSIDVQRIVVMT
ncbi:MAG: hypothetical protein JZU55_15115 [Afipia sp.]|nr:hypothetical protein [Afipia sp.]